jgi:hypothetical protein
MKLYSKPLFITTVVSIGINILIGAYFHDLWGTVAWGLLMFAEFRMKHLEQRLDDCIEREDCWYRIATGKMKREVRDAD